jgi:hypothetical protein
MDPPELLYRSDFESNPFPVSPPGTRWSELPVKTAEGVFGTPLNDVWHIVAPRILTLFKERSVKYSALKTARFSARDEDGKKSLGPIVIWVATHPNTTSAENARDVSPDILDILKEHKVEGAVVEWYEGSVEKLSGPALMRITDETNPTYYVRRTFTAALGMPIATKEMEDADAQGSVSFFFHENKDKNGEPSARVLAVSNKHVLRQDTTVDYQFMGRGAPRQIVRVCGLRRFQRSIYEIRALVTKNVAEAVRLTGAIATLEAMERSDDEEQAAEEEEALQTKKDQLVKVNKDNGKLQAFFNEVTTQWNDIERRNIGFVDWAPSISTDVDDRHYTRDIGTVELSSQKFQKYFRGNVVQLGAFSLSSISISPHKNNPQETNSHHMNSTVCSGPITAIRLGSSPMASSGSTGLSSVKTFPCLTALMKMGIPLTSSGSMAAQATLQWAAIPDWRHIFVISLVQSLWKWPFTTIVRRPATSPQRATLARSSSLAMVVCSLSFIPACQEVSAAMSPTALLPGGLSSNSKDTIPTPT